MSLNKFTYDVAVIGAGPAGSTAARHLALAGYKVIILEKEDWPRYKTCGGGLTARALSELPDDFHLPAQHLCHSSTINISDVNLTFTARRKQPIIYMTMRDELDAMLVATACEAGAEFHDNWQVNKASISDDHVTIHSGSDSINAKLIIAADGVNSRVATQLGFPDERILAPAIEWEVPISSPQVGKFADNALFEFGLLRDGYAWIFPKDGHLSVGLGAMRGRGGHLPQTLTRFLQDHDIPVNKTIRRKGQLIPVSPRKSKLAEKRTFLVGDAAGLVDPVTAEGLNYAMQSGRLSAESIIEADADPSRGASIYHSKLHASLLQEIRYANWLAILLYTFPKWRNWLFKRHGQRLTERMADLVMGKTNYRDVLHQSSFWLRLLGIK